MFEARKKLEAIGEGILRKEYNESTSFHFDVSFDESRGDLTTSVALQVAKKAGQKPRDVAEVLAKGFKNADGVESVEVAGPGFVNITLTAAALLDGVKHARKAILPSKKRKEAPIVIDYSGPNIAKPLGIHHILSTVIGQALVNLNRHMGYETVGINHIGDWGTQFGKLAVAHQKWGTKPVKEHSIDDLLALYVKFHDEVENDATLEDQGRLAFKKLEDGDKDLQTFWKSVVDITMSAMQDVYRRLHVEFDYVHGESFYEDKMEAILTEGKKKKVFTPGKEGALIVEFPEDMKMPPAIALKADGSTIYLTRDLATAKYRIDTWHPQAILYVVDIAQQLHFKQLFETLKMLGWELPSMEHIVFGRMSFGDRSMSTRKGNILRLEEVLDEAVKRAGDVIKERGEKIQTDDEAGLAEMMGVGSVVYGILSQNRKMDMVFDWDKMLSFEGNSAPYLQYTHARAKSVLRKANSEGKDTSIDTLTSKERVLLKLLLSFSVTVEEARSEKLPHKLTNYLYELCQAFNSFYNSDEIITASKETQDFRLALTSLTADTLKVGAELLTLRVPERM